MVNDRIPTKITKISERQFEMIIESGKFTQEELDVLKWYSGKIETYLKNMSGSKWRNESTMSEKDKIQVTDILHYLKLINDKVKFTNFDIEKASNHYEKTGKFNSDIKEIIRDYQFLTSKQIELLGQPLLRNTDKSELEKLDGILKIGKYNGGRLKVETEGEIGRINKNDAKFELNINNGKGSLTIYEKVNVREENGKIGKSKDYVKTRVINFDLNKKTYNTEIWHIHGDGIWGTDTSNGLNFIMEKLTKVEKPITISLGFSMNEYYTNRNYDKTNLFTYTRINDKSPLSQIKKIMEELSPESQRKILFDEKYKKYDMQLLLNKSTDKYGDKDINAIKKLIEDFKRDTKNMERRKENTFYFINKTEKTNNFIVDYSMINDHLKKLGLSKDEIGVMINEIEKIKNQSKNSEDFRNKLDENDNIKKMFQKITIDFSYCPLEANLYEMSIYKYSPKSNEKENIEITKILKKYMDGNEEFNNKIEKYLKTDLTRYKEEYIDMSGLKKDFPNIYNKLILDLHDMEYNRVVKPLKTIQSNVIAESIPKTEIKKSKPEEEEVEPTKIKVVPTKSPSEQEVQDFIKLMKKSSPLAKVYQEYYNERMKEEGKKYRLKVDGIVKDLTIATSKELPFDEFWALYNNQSTYERKILPKIKEKIQEDPVEMKKYNAYVQKMDKEIGGRPVEDKWTYLTSYINRLESVKKQQKEEKNPENKYRIAK